VTGAGRDGAARDGARRNAAGVVMVVSAAAGWGTWTLFLYPAALPAQLATVIIFAVMGLSTLPFALAEPAPVWDRRAVGLLLANTACDVLNNLCFFGALHYHNVTIAVLTHYAAPIIIALVAPSLDGVTTRGARPAALVALVGLVIVLEPWRKPATGAVMAAILGFASAVFYAGTVFSVKRFAAVVGPSRAISYHSVLGALLLLPLALPHLAAATGSGVGYLAIGAILLGTCANSLFVRGLARIGAARTAVLTFVEPLVAVAIGALVWGEHLGPLAVVGGLLVLAAGLHVARQAR
jgi:DME family drug/metabolite transporter